MIHHSLNKLMEHNNIYDDDDPSLTQKFMELDIIHDDSDNHSQEKRSHL